MWYVAYDDEGIIKIGAKRECLASIVELVENGELDNVYNENDLMEIFNYFSKKHEDEDEMSFSGFYIERTL